LSAWLAIFHPTKEYILLTGVFLSVAERTQEIKAVSPSALRVIRVTRASYQAAAMHCWHQIALMQTVSQENSHSCVTKQAWR
jgi:hypothetical protein